MNCELLRVEGVPMLCLNGALDKVTSGYYSNLLNPQLGACAERFYSRFEQVYYLKPLGSGRGWLFRVYGEPWYAVPGSSKRSAPWSASRGIPFLTRPNEFPPQAIVSHHARRLGIGRDVCRAAHTASVC